MPAHAACDRRTYREPLPGSAQQTAAEAAAAPSRLAPQSWAGANEKTVLNQHEKMCSPIKLKQAASIKIQSSGFETA